MIDAHDILREKVYQMRLAFQPLQLFFKLFVFFFARTHWERKGTHCCHHTPCWLKWKCLHETFSVHNQLICIFGCWRYSFYINIDTLLWMVWTNSIRACTRISLSTARSRACAPYLHTLFRFYFSFFICCCFYFLSFLLCERNFSFVFVLNARLRRAHLMPFYLQEKPTFAKYFRSGKKKLFAHFESNSKLLAKCLASPKWKEEEEEEISLFKSKDFICMSRV